MANTEKSKLKTLLLYDYFLKNINAYDENSSVSLPDIQNYLLNVTGVEFERKSIYADIKRLNEFAVEVGLVKPGEEWIYLNSRKYTRGEISYELSLDEARLIVDAIRTTPFTDSGLCEKIEKRYPAYFKGGYKALIPHDNTVKTSRSKRSRLWSLSTAIISQADFVPYLIRRCPRWLSTLRTATTI